MKAMRPHDALALLSALLAATAGAGPGARADLLVGDTSCVAGDRDCNPCANDVEASFAAMADGARAAVGPEEPRWSFEWDRPYPPSQSRPSRFFDDWVRAISRQHIQGFVKTHHPRFRYAGTHSHEEGNAGTFFLVREGDDGRNRLSHVIRTAGHSHPSSLSVVGGFAFFGLDDIVGVIDMDRADENHLYDLGLPVPAKGAAGGLGMTKLADGAHLLAVIYPTTKADGSPRDPDITRRNYLDSRSRTMFFRVEGGFKEGAPRSVAYLGDSAYSQPAHWENYYGRSESVSLLNECGTGRVFAIHVTGQNQLFGSGYWLLSEIVSDGTGKLARVPLRSAWQKQTKNSCHLRTSGTVFVNPDHQLEFVCHERDTREGLFEKRDHFEFRVFSPSSKRD